LLNANLLVGYSCFGCNGLFGRRRLFRCGDTPGLKPAELLFQIVNSSQERSPRGLQFVVELLDALFNGRIPRPRPAESRPAGNAERGQNQ
jgi:hypothetical protein